MGEREGGEGWMGACHVISVVLCGSQRFFIHKFRNGLICNQSTNYQMIFFSIKISMRRK